jgi:urease accessory protein
MIMRRAILTTLIAAVVFVPTIAVAHTGHGDTAGLVHGFIHPITGIDHVLAMVAVGALAAQLGGRALWLVPLSFVSAMALGGTLGMAGIPFPFGEFGVALSVIVLGLAIALPLRLQTPPAVAVAGLLALFHGYVHGAEMPADASALYYTVGFIGATTMLHATGIGVGLLLGKLGRRVVQTDGGSLVGARRNYFSLAE